MDIRENASAIADRVDHNAVGIDPLTIVTIITQILPGLLNCFRENDDVQSPDMKHRLQQLHERNPGRLLKRVARNIKRRSEEPLTLQQATAMAQATIDHVLNSPAEMIVACCDECGQRSTELQELEI
jgi:hypothetical protein